MMASASSDPASAGNGERLDLVVFGATGFTGQFVVEQVARVQSDRSGRPLRWAVAGRSNSKLAAIIDQASEHTAKNLSEVEVIIADVNDFDSLSAMARRCCVVLNCVGPYRFYGEQVVKACVQEGASHVDISGEPQYLEKMQLHYHKSAEQKGVYVVGACGFDSIPADMGMLFIKDKFSGDLNGVESYFKVDTGKQGYDGIHYATYQSAIHGFANQAELGPLRRQLFGKRLPRSAYPLPKRGLIHYSSAFNGYCLPFMGSDKSVVQRTVFHQYEHDDTARNVQYSPYVVIGNLFYTVLVTLVAAVFGVMASFRAGRFLLERFPRVFTLGAVSHQGPTRQQMAHASFSMTFLASGWRDRLPRDAQHTEAPNMRMTAKVSGPECGYVATPICLVQCALTILDEKHNLPGTGGVFSPGAAFAATSLIKRLNEHGVRFEVVDENK